MPLAASSAQERSHFPKSPIYSNGDEMSTWRSWRCDACDAQESNYREISLPPSWRQMTDGTGHDVKHICPRCVRQLLPVEPLRQPFHDNGGMGI